MDLFWKAVVQDLVQGITGVSLKIADCALFAVGDEHHFGPGLTYAVEDAGRGDLPVHKRGNCTEKRNSKLDLDVFDAVPAHDADNFAGLHAGFLQRVRGAAAVFI